MSDRLFQGKPSFGDEPTRPLRFCALVYFVLLGIIVSFVYVYSFNFPQADDFIFADWYRRFSSGEMRVWDLLFERNTSHPVAVMAAIVIALSSLVPINFSLIVGLNVALLLSTQLAIVRAVSPWLSPRLRSLAPVLLLLVVFHTSQTNHVLWPFELCWFLITFLLVLNCWMIERIAPRWLPLTFAAALAASLSSAHGIFLWPTAALLVGLKYGRGQRVMIAAHLLGFAIWALIILHIKPVEEGHASLGQVPQLALYVLELFGGTAFAVRDPTTALAFGIALFGFCAAMVVLAWASQPLTSGLRVGIVLMASSFMMAIAFALGRYQHGLAWALYRFHAAPQIMPLVAGLLVLALALLDRTQSRTLRSVCAVILVVAVASSLSGVRYALSRADESRTSRATAMHYTCEDKSSYLYAVLNGFSPAPGGADVVRRTMPYLCHLCGQPLPHRARVLSEFPPRFAELVLQNDGYAQPLRDLWEAYVASPFLQRMFWIEDGGAADRVIEFAKSNASQGTPHYADKLKPHESFFSSL
ncbi:MAG: hypothetical protein ACJ8F3_18290 [Xanthobacteraceae bacterium]